MFPGALSLGVSTHFAKKLRAKSGFGSVVNSRGSSLVVHSAIFPQARGNMNGILPSTYVAGFHDESAVRKARYSRLGRTDMVVSNFGLGGTVFGAKLMMFCGAVISLVVWSLFF